jgi:hypothetical protein
VASQLDPLLALAALLALPGCCSACAGVVADRIGAWSWSSSTACRILVLLSVMTS